MRRRRPRPRHARSATPASCTDPTASQSQNSLARRAPPLGSSYYYYYVGLAERERSEKRQEEGPKSAAVLSRKR